ncbi:hypothetical protein RRG08_067346 [Elysia crispata]|uniref:Androglobin n=1 Tax=Elysia crispata TaxID=231223 RepID=A0AAE1BC81_9GAST|nr:hypothetical protein RRG08_067346 [Elysia crispata]
MAAKTSKKGGAATRVSSATPREAASLAASAGGQDSKRPKFSIWPEWNDVDVNAEKWDAAKKEDKKGKSPTVAVHYFEDPEGKIEMPPSLRVDSWKRPTDFIQDKLPVVVDTDNVPNGFDLIANNEHLHESEFLRYCISQIMALWDMCAVTVPPENMPDTVVPGDDPTHTWRPWEHIYALCKAGRGPHLPLYNNHGKYVVRLYWMGCWRKIIIDDAIPFDDQGRMLLPATTLKHELWPMLLTKALIKVASLDYAGGNPSQEFGDVTVLQCLTGWIPEAIPLQQGHMKEVWELMKNTLPEWRLPEQEWEKPLDQQESMCKESTPSEGPTKEDKIEKELSNKDVKEGKEKGKEAGKEKSKDGKDKEKGKDDKKDKKDKDKDKDKGNKGKEKEKLQEEKSNVEDFVLPEKPEIVMFATYSSSPKYPVKVSVLGEMADASEKLRQNGLSHMYPHPVCITQTRSCPMEPPPPPIVIPAWKLIRPRKKKVPPHDEPVPDPEPPKEIQCLEITSPFVNYKVSPVPIPTDTHRPKSSLERGGARSRADTENPIEEGDENAPTPPPVPITPEPEPLPVDEPKEEEEPKARDGAPKRKASGKSSRSKPGSASKDRGAASKRPESRQSMKDAKEVPKEVPPPGGPPLGNVLAGGLAPPVQPVIGPNGEPLPLEEEPQPEPPQDNTPKPKKAWMDFDIFCKCFRTLYVFHKSNTYLCNQRYSDLKNVTASAVTAASKNEKKPPQTTTATSDGTSPFYLFVDNLAPTDIVVSYSVLSRWFDPPVPTLDDKKSLSLIRQTKDKEGDKEATNASISLESVAGEQKPPPSVTPGTLVAEPYSWKSLVTGQPILRLRTTGTKSAVLSLPPGRHVLRFMMTSPLGHHVHMCSTVNFVFGDEETVMPQLTNESCRFRDNATQVIMNLGKCILGFSDAEQFQTAWAGFVRSHCPYLDDKQMSKKRHFQTFNDALYSMLKKTIKDIITPDIAFAWRAFTFDATTPNILAIPVGSRPETHQSAGSATGSASVRGSAKPSSKKRGGNQQATAVTDSNAQDQGEAEKPENPWANREATLEEQIAAVKIQKSWRGYYVQKIKRARTPGTEENSKVQESLNRCWPIVESSMEENGLALLREMFKKEPDIMPQYPFYQDEWNKISYADYKGSYPDQTSMNWFIVFRDIFHVKEEMLVVPRMYVPISTCMLRVIDNDTGQEIPRVFQKVAPYVYKRNKKGYSFVAEARTVEQPLSGGNWRMRLIGSLNALPAPHTGEVCCNFVTKEIRDYYVPNPQNVIFRQSVKVTEDHFASLQVNTSKRDVYIKLAVLDNEEEVISSVGKGHVVIPAFTFLKDITQDDIDARRSSSRASTKNAAPPTTKAEKVGSKIKRTESAVSQEQSPPSRNSMRSDAELAERFEDTRPHKYIIQATVLQNSWPLSESSWRFVQILKEMEKNELKVSNKERPPSPPKVEKTPAGGSKTKAKGGKDKGGKDKGQDGKGSRPSSQQFDITKPHWTLRVVSDAVTAEEIEVKKDTERADEIRAMKKAWEDAEPGRAAKAMQSRLKYLNSHTIRLQPSSEDTTQSGTVTASMSASNDDQTQGAIDAVPSGTLMSGTNLPQAAESGTSMTEQEASPPTPVSFGDHFESDTALTLEPPPMPQPKEILEPLDKTPFIRRTLPEPKYLDENEIERLLADRQQKIADYKAFRAGVEQWRELDRQNRNKTKLQQLEQCQALQAALDAARERVNIPREAIRQRFLDAERLKLEEAANQEAAMKADLEAKSPKRKKSATGKKKK